MECERFCNYHCCTDDCPNIQRDIADERWGCGIADDMGLPEVDCKDCAFQDKFCGCDDCYFNGGKDCPKNGGELNAGKQEPV